MRRHTKILYVLLSMLMVIAILPMKPEVKAYVDMKDADPAEDLLFRHVEMEIPTTYNGVDYTVYVVRDPDPVTNRDALYLTAMTDTSPKKTFNFTVFLDDGSIKEERAFFLTGLVDGYMDFGNEYNPDAKIYDLYYGNADPNIFATKADSDAYVCDFVNDAMQVIHDSLINYFCFGLYELGFKNYQPNPFQINERNPMTAVNDINEDLASIVYIPPVYVTYNNVEYRVNLCFATGNGHFDVAPVEGEGYYCIYWNGVGVSEVYASFRKGSQYPNEKCTSFAYIPKTYNPADELHFRFQNAMPGYYSSHKEMNDDSNAILRDVFAIVELAMQQKTPGYDLTDVGFVNYYDVVTPIPTPTEDPTVTPTPTEEPTVTPTITSTVTPTNEPTVTSVPTVTSTPDPVATATPVPTVTAMPTLVPTVTVAPTVIPTVAPTATSVPTVTATPTAVVTPTNKPTVAPTATSVPTTVPTVVPTEVPAATPTVVERDPEGVNGFIERLYSVALNRKSDAEGKEYWSKQVKTEGKTGSDLALSFLFSNEFLNKNMTNDQFIDILYKTCFDREADEAGKKYWVDELASGNQTRKEIILGFVNSPEWANICLTYGIMSGTDVQPTITIAPTERIESFAERLYTTCLGREAEEAGIEYWANEIANLKQSGSQVAKDFFFCEEFVNSNVSDAEFLTRLYKTVMGREPEKAGYDYWLGEMKSGRKTRENVFDGFAASVEWAGICVDAGILR